MAQDAADPDGMDEDTAEAGAPAGNVAGSIRALSRGLAVLEALNILPLASVTDIAQAVALPRTTAYRVLETLCAGGFAERTPEERYRLLAGVNRLADGFETEPWIGKIARPAAAALVRDLAWPLLLATPHGLEMKLHRLGEPGLPLRAPLATSAAGLAYLAALPAAAQAAFAVTGGPASQDLAAVATRGAAIVDQGEVLDLAVAVIAAGWPVASLAVAIPRGGLTADQPAEAALDRITGLLTALAAEIATALAAP